VSVYGQETRLARVTVPALAAAKRNRQPLAMLTAYDYPTAQIVDEAGADLVLVGDSAANVVLGLPSTTGIGMAEMTLLAAAVRRGLTRALLVVDMPFLSYQVSDEDAVRNAGRLMTEGGADVVKLEGAGTTIDRIRAIVSAGIPVMAHLGLTPQTATALGGNRAQGRTAGAALALVEDAAAVARAGAVAMVLEAVPPLVAAAVTGSVAIPTIGIGAGSDCDGQVLVFHDLVGLTRGPSPRFVERYADVAGVAIDAVARFCADVRAGTFPRGEHTYSMPPEEEALFLSARGADSSDFLDG
jgi:3-methyl-2-oxobutanoate hydroxymethyltransferase